MFIVSKKHIYAFGGIGPIRHSFMYSVICMKSPQHIYKHNNVCLLQYNEIHPLSA